MIVTYGKQHLKKPEKENGSQQCREIDAQTCFRLWHAAQTVQSHIILRVLHTCPPLSFRHRAIAILYIHVVTQKGIGREIERLIVSLQLGHLIGLGVSRIVHPNVHEKVPISRRFPVIDRTDMLLSSDSVTPRGAIRHGRGLRWTSLHEKTLHYWISRRNMRHWPSCSRVRNRCPPDSVA